ncbi:hypothetical protein D6829_02600 [Candidatus Pacearchaeota archaeon]|nr:MAG: hypothetical protein D6829_02600 [Candidatus Pacearchaeota archaeon]
MGRWIAVLGVFLVMISISSAAHFIVGRVNDALDGTSANGRTIVLWNPANGMSDNLTDTVGPSGNSGVSNTYMIDCELLQTPCKVGDGLRVKIFDSGDGYVTDLGKVNVTGAGFDIVPNLTLNSPPNVSLLEPAAWANISSQVQFNCSVSDLDGNLANVTLYGNWSGGWHANETKQVSGSSDYATFTKDLPEGYYKWTCKVFDNLSISKIASNRSFAVDKTSPQISSVQINESYVCGQKYVRVNCTATDSMLGIESVTIRAFSPTGSSDHAASLLSGNTYFSDILIDKKGKWNFTCIANDSAKNSANKSTGNMFGYSQTADLVVSSDYIFFSNENPIEKEAIKINATVFNMGCSDSVVFLVGFFEGDPSLGAQIGDNQSISILARSNKSVNVSWNAKIGPTDIFVFADVGQIVSEDNESDNKASRQINVNAWQEFYGRLSSNKILSNNESSKFDIWLNETITTGNIFASDIESDISWGFLQAIGKNVSGGEANSDFSEIDQILGMADFNDSVSNTFTSDGNTPLDTENFTVNGQKIAGVPIINSTNNSNFITGILWDSSDDSDGEFGTTDNEDLVFVTKINPNSPGKYGAYDYEIRIPAKLRSQNQSDSSNVYFYYELN